MGKVTIDGEGYFGDAIFSEEGAAQLYIGGPYSGEQEIQLASPQGSIHFAGNGGSGSFTGRIIGREPDDCGSGTPSLRWCSRASSASIQIEAETDGETGAIRGEIDVQDEVWTLDLHALGTVPTINRRAFMTWRDFTLSWSRHLPGMAAWSGT